MPLSLSLPLDHTYLIFAAAVAGFALVAGGFFVLSQFCSHAGYNLPWMPAQPDAESVRCRYCHIGRAYLHDGTARIDGDDLVEVKCFACRACGLPQWKVERSPVLRRAA